MKMPRIALQLGAIALVLSLLPAAHAGKAHQHGVAKLDVAIEGNKFQRAPAGVPRGRASSDDVCGASRKAASHRNTVRRDTPSPADTRVTLLERSLVSTSAAMAASRRLASSHWASVACTSDATDVTVGSDDVGARSSEAEIVHSPPLARSRTTTPPSLPTRTTATNRSAATATASGSA